MKKRVLSIILAVAVILCVFPFGCFSAFAESATKYIERSWDSTEKKVTETEQDIPKDAKQIAEETTELTNGWYILTKNVYLPYETTLTVTGDNVNIILSDGCTLSTSTGIIINNGTVLNIYGQKNDTGEICVEYNDDGITGIDNKGTLNIHGGTVNSDVGYNGGAGIGNSGTLYVYGGSVDAIGGGYSAGIGGGGEEENSGDVYIYGGSVHAKSEGDGAGIGGGDWGNGGNVYIYGGTVNASSENCGAGIGGGNCGKDGDFYYYGGTVTAFSVGYSAGIGAGSSHSYYKNFVIDNKAITGIKAGYNSESAEFVSADEYNDERYSYVNIFICANHVDEDASGWCDKCGKFTVKNYQVLDLTYRESGNEPNNFSGNILLSGDVTLNNPVVINGNVTLYIADMMTLTALKGIVLNEGNSLTITSQAVSGGVEAHGDVGAAGIGGAVGKNAGSLTVNGGMSIFSYGGLGAPGIGGGLGGKDGEFTKNGSSVYTENGTGYVHEHTFASTYTYNGTHHWHASTCGHDVVSGFGAHSYTSIDGTQHQCTCGKTENHTFVNGACVCGATRTQCCITFDLGTYEGMIDPIEPIYADKGNTFSAPTEPSYHTAVFGGWYMESECINKWNFNSDTVQHDMTLYAKWIPKSCKVWLYYGNLGEEIDRDKRVSITAEYGKNLPDITPPEREGLVFLGYYTTGYKVGEGAVSSVQYYNSEGKGVREWDIETGVASLIAFWAPGTLTPAHEHTFSSGWTFNDIYHWHECTCAGNECIGFVAGFGMHNFGEGVDKGDVTVYTCADCGYQKKSDNHSIDTESDQAPEGIEFYGISLTLSSDIAINFYMNLTEDAADNSLMFFTVGDRSFTAAAQYNEKVGKYYFRCPLTSLETAQTVKANFHFLGMSLKKEYSVKTYIETVIENKEGKFDNYLISLCKKIADYSHSAQIYLASIHGGVIIGEGGFPEMPSYTTPDIAAAKTALSEYKFTDDCANTNITGISRSLNLDDKVAMNFYITVKDGYELTANMITVSGGKSFTLVKTADNIYRITVLGIEAKNFGESYTVTIGGETITASVLSYANKILNTEGYSENAVNTMAALYEYYYAAVEYGKSLKTFTVKFDTHGMGQTIQTVKYGGKVTRPSPDPIDITPQKLQFGGWFKDKDCTVEWDFDKDVITEDTTIYGKWIENDA